MRAGLLLSAILLSGCTTTEKFFEAFKQQNLANQGYSSRLITPESTAPTSIEELLKKGEDSSRSENEQRKIRNFEQSKLLAKSEVNCNYFVESIHNQRAARNISFGTMTTIASTAAAIVAGRAGQNLAGTAAVLSSTNNSINQEMYQGILMPAITKEILQTRKDLYAKIATRQQDDISAYPYPLAIVDAIAYHNLCSIPFALVGLVNKAEAAPTSAIDNSAAILSIDNEINRIKNLLNDSSLGFSSEEKSTLSKQILALNERRNLFVTAHALPQVKGQPGNQPPPVAPPVAPATDTPVPLSIPGLEAQ
ncbi:hypothetical protein QMK47_19520 [Pseudomonas sp. P9_35]|uniref:hypothetical protein n=1 Tax=unclassified Pseudomonas TaxID=196821 RepID=UPI002A35CD87|nr:MULTISPECIES: hypothetical protein [unclassified Pseudomonas]WPN61727.1 hypothetical protein QMK48_18620 [Pseudomonas sp. P9_32]WPN67482.1 hypothetical protein QMK47_19520 [Pseudomonas sp. P9_35]